MDNSWFSITRKLLKSDLWLSEPFNKGQAWVDLVGNAFYAPGSIWVRGIEVKLERGQLGISEEKLSERWQWSRSKVRRYLKLLNTRQQIEQQNSNITSIITILNYNKHQPGDTANDTANDTAKEQQKNSKPNNVLKEDIKDKEYLKDNNIAQSDGIAHEPPLEVPIQLKNLELYATDKKLIKAWPKLYKALQQGYPNVNLRELIPRLHAWETANPNKRKKDRPKFFHNRCRAEQDKYKPGDIGRSIPGIAPETEVPE